MMEVGEPYSAAGQIIFPGTVRAFKRADLAFRVDGTVIKRDIVVGQQMKKGELLLQLDPRDYELALEKAVGKIQSTQAQLDFASRDYVRMMNIYKADPGAISQSFLDRKKENENQLIADLKVAKTDGEKASDDLSYTYLKTPFDGIVAAIYVENHEQVHAKQTVVRFLDTTDREMEINVPERYINRLLEGKEKLAFQVRLDAFPNMTFKATIEEVGTEASSTTQTYPVTLTLNEIAPDLSLLAGMSGRATLEQPSGEQKAPTYRIPKSAIFSDNLHATNVWMIDPATETVRKTPVKLEEGNKGDFALVTEGLKTGDRVVTAGTSFLNEGQKVKYQ
jgi:RND family efflux transporter MFP subunit